MTQLSFPEPRPIRPLPRCLCALLAILVLACWPGGGIAEPQSGEEESGSGTPGLQDDGSAALADPAASLEQERLKTQLKAKLRRALKSKATVEQKLQRSREGTFRAGAEHALSAETIPYLPLSGEWTDGERKLVLQEVAGGRLTISKAGDWQPARSYRTTRTTWTVSLEGDTIHLKNGQLRQLREQGTLELALDGNRLTGAIELFDDFAREGQPAPGKIGEEKVDWRRRLELDTRTVLAWREALLSAPKRAEKAQVEREAAEAAERAKQEEEASRLEAARVKTQDEQRVLEEGFEEEPSEEEQAASIPEMPPVPVPPVLELVDVAPTGTPAEAATQGTSGSVDTDFDLGPTAPAQVAPTGPTTGAAQVTGAPALATTTGAADGVAVTTATAVAPLTTAVAAVPPTTASTAETAASTAEQVDPRTMEELQDYAANYVPRLLLAISDVRRLDQELAKLGISNPKASQDLLSSQFAQAVQTLSQMAGDRTPLGGELREAHRGLYQASKKYEAMLASYEELLQSRKTETMMEIAEQSQEAAEGLNSFRDLLTAFGKKSGVDIQSLGF